MITRLWKFGYDISGGSANYESGKVGYVAAATEFEAKAQAFRLIARMNENEKALEARGGRQFHCEWEFKVEEIGEVIV